MHRLDLPLMIVGNKTDRLSAREIDTLQSTCAHHVFTSTVRREDFNHLDFTAFFERVLRVKRGLEVASHANGSVHVPAPPTSLSSPASPNYGHSPFGHMLRHREKKQWDGISSRACGSEDGVDIESNDDGVKDSKRLQ